ncbi:RRM domain and KH domain protein [Ichthyophthirius multifiliis]|uniref:RRM domain and KH domain protein n=1 Tax=Ichthyophthirius multifiliis TaxID=5932 RepID=G0QYQ9_ICHMU|nr:RRM domain and KH domain protein [Ichthyophthirius multifiliis]EGR29646.1 RRM domain and KH domain protein [Ichthyophthirius multifiliis]|eukprot:XP_004030882.1 RRM domain and KH domain protein [Ichthyophthirius multifiliis]
MNNNTIPFYPSIQEFPKAKESQENQGNNLKYTCRYEIQIQNDKDFQIARKIIGSKGENMKSIIKKCIDASNQKGYINEKDDQTNIVKLRLRGIGSGYKEGPNKQESQEPLHLCVSSKQQEVFSIACQFVEDLLQNIYEQYYKYCQTSNCEKDVLLIKKQDSMSCNIINNVLQKKNQNFFVDITNNLNKKNNKNNNNILIKQFSESNKYDFEENDFLFQETDKLENINQIKITTENQKKCYIIKKIYFIYLNFKNKIKRIKKQKQKITKSY